VQGGLTALTCRSLCGGNSPQGTLLLAAVIHAATGEWRQPSAPIRTPPLAAGGICPKLPDAPRKTGVKRCPT